MAITTSILTAGTNGHQTTSEEANRFVTNFITPGVVGAFTANTGSGGTGAYSINAAGTPNKTVLIGTGDVVLSVTPATQATQNLTARNDAIITQTLSDNVSGSTVYDWIYVAADSTKANNPNLNGTDVSSIVVNRSTSIASDTVGAPANSQLLAAITLTSGFTSIPNSAITDKRTASSAAILPGSIGTTQLGNKAVTPSKFAPIYKMGLYGANGATLSGGYTNAVLSSGWSNPSITLTAASYVRLSFTANTSYGATGYGSSWLIVTSNDNATWRGFTGSENGATLGVVSPFGSTFNSITTSSGELVGNVAAEGAVVLAAGTYYFVPQFTARINTGTISYTASISVEVLGLF